MIMVSFHGGSSTRRSAQELASLELGYPPDPNLQVFSILQFGEARRRELATTEFLTTATIATRS
jgi:hypothetical protein